MNLDLTLHVWRQPGPTAAGKLVRYQVKGVSSHASFLELLDILNEDLTARGEEPVAFDSDCREGICGMCSLVINGRPHGGRSSTTTCQLHMYNFEDGDEIYVEPWRAGPFPVIKDLIVDRSKFDDIIAAGGFVNVNAGSAPDANAVLVPKEDADRAFAAAACIGCGACVAACPNGSAMLFVAAKLSHLHHLPQGRAEKKRRTKSMVRAMDAAGFGNCSNLYECEAVCPVSIKRNVMTELNRGYANAVLTHADAVATSDD